MLLEVTLIHSPAHHPNKLIGLSVQSSPGSAVTSPSEVSRHLFASSLGKATQHYPMSLVPRGQLKISRIFQGIGISLLLMAISLQWVSLRFNKVTSGVSLEKLS